MADAKNSKTKVLVIYPTPLHNPAWGEAMVLRDISKLLTKRGYELSVLTMGDKPQQLNEGYNETVLKAPEIPKASDEKPKEYVAMLQGMMGTFFSQRSAYNYSDEMASEVRRRKPDVILTSNLYPPHAIDVLDIAMEYKEERASHGAAPKLVVTTDDFREIPEFFHLARQSFFKGQNPGVEQTASYEKVEQLYIARLEALHVWMLKAADAVVYYSDEDLEVGRSRLERSESGKLMRIQPLQDMNMDVKVEPRETLDTTIFLGNSRHLPNAIAKEVIRERIAPKVPEVTFVMAGPGGPEYKQGNVESLGFVDDADALIRASDLYIAPIQSGHGVKTKLLSPIAQGVPILSTPLGAEGFPVVNGRNMVVEGDVDQFPVWIRRLGDRETRKKLAANAITDMGGYFSSETVGNRWDNTLSFLVRQ